MIDLDLLSKLSHHPDFVAWVHDNDKCSCGSEKALFDYVPDRILFFVSVALACCIHDHRYTVGGDAADKLFADREFLNNILTIVEDYGDKHLFYPTIIARQHAMIYYNSVIVGGKKSFNFKKEEVEDGSVDSEDRDGAVDSVRERSGGGERDKRRGNFKRRVQRLKSKRGVS